MESGVQLNSGIPKSNRLIQVGLVGPGMNRFFDLEPKDSKQFLREGVKLSNSNHTEIFMYNIFIMICPIILL